MITGNRVNYGINCIGGVRRDIIPEYIKDILSGVKRLEERTKYYIDIVTKETTIIKRLSNVGILSHADALALGAVGPTGRASGVDRDTRRDDPYAAYDQLDFKVVTDSHCDVYGRTVVRLGELLESYKIIRQVLKELPDGPIAIKAPRKIPAGEAVSRCEAPRGENMHYVKANGTEKPERVKVRAPTLANLRTVSKMLEDRQLADLPIVIAAIDPCFSCVDRLVSVKEPDRKRAKILKWDELREYGIHWYQHRGVDFTEINKKLRKKL